MACGGSGGNPTAPGGPTVDAVEAASFRLINEARADAGVAPLEYDDRLAMAARRHSEDMRDQGYFSHIDPQGNGPGERIEAAGVSFHVAAENIVEVTHPLDPASLAHRTLLQSPEHRLNILGPEFEIAGVGAAQSGETWWITQLFVEP
jgi:uncharacterized protein YkwD